jgi:serine/threonine protein phosphatase PrpC
MDEDGLGDTATDLRVQPVQLTPPRPVMIDIAGRTHPGKVRANNEDNFHIVQFGRYLRTVMSSLPAGEFPEEQDRPGYGFVVADGMGGHAAGEVASHRAIALLVEYALQTPDWNLSQEASRLATVMERTAQRFEAVNDAVVAQAREVPGLWGMGSTLTLAMSLGDDLIVAHVGDSPVYLFRGGNLHRLTTDHTLAQQRREYDEAYAARFRNVLTRAIGMPEGGEPDIKRYRLTDGDRLLLCTDGLTDMVDDLTIAGELARVGTAADVCQALIDLALDRGGRDNVTVIVATYNFPAPPGT